LNSLGSIKGKRKDRFGEKRVCSQTESKVTKGVGSKKLGEKGNVSQHILQKQFRKRGI